MSRHGLGCGVTLALVTLGASSTALAQPAPAQGALVEAAPPVVAPPPVWPVAPLAAPPPPVVALPVVPLASASQPVVSPLPPGVIDPSRYDEPALAGYHDGFYFRDRSDTFRLFPRAQIFLDANTFFGPGVAGLSTVDGGTALAPRFYARRIRPEIGGEITRYVRFLLGVDFGGQAVTNTNGATQQSAASVGKAPTADSARYAAVEASGPAATPANCWIDLSFLPELHVMLGQYQAPFSMENRTADNVTPWMERNLAIRGFVVPTGKEIGATVWGDFGGRLLSYEVGVFSGDGQNRPQVDRDADVMGRVFSRPFSGGSGPLARAQIGASGMMGIRDNAAVAYDLTAITTQQGFTLWSPTYKDSKGRLVHVLPSGAQRAVGGELRLPFSRFELRGEAYYVARNTREALDGYVVTNTERLGQLRGVGWYAQASVWAWGDAFASAPPGFFRPPDFDLSKPAPPRKNGLEILAIVAGVNAHYDGASRAGVADSKTPGGSAAGTAINAYEVGLGATYWYTRHFRVSVNYHAYVTPGSGTPDDLAVVPGNVGKSASSSAHVLHELGGRVGVMF